MLSRKCRAYICRNLCRLFAFMAGRTSVLRTHETAVHSLGDDGWAFCL
jgi:hypothetical protein